MPASLFDRFHVLLVASLLLSSTATQAPQNCAAAEEGYTGSKDNFFLQLAIQLDAPDAPEEEAQKLASLLRLARKECLKSTAACLPILSELRLAVWPHMQAETNGTNSTAAWMPGWQMDQMIGFNRDSMGFLGSKTWAFRHIYKAGGINVHANLQQSTSDFKRTMWHTLCQGSHFADTTNLTTFTFVRNPIDRFISGYAEIEYEALIGNYWPEYDSLAKLLKAYSPGSPERAHVFLDEFLRTGIDADGHVRPQLEFFLPTHGCSMVTKFVGKDEHLSEDWQALFASQNQTVPAFNSELAVHSHGHRDHKAMRSFLGLATDGSKGEASRHGANYVRALCWLFLGDFAVFDYELPDECLAHGLLKNTLELFRNTSSET